MKWSFFYEKIQEIISRNKRPLDLMNWVKKCKLLAIKALQFNWQLCIKLEDIWQALHHMFNLAQNWQINLWILDKVPAKPISKWLTFSKAEFRDAIKKCSSLSMFGSDHILWHHLKILTADDKCVTNFINIANRYINLGYWPLYFKMFLLVIILKLNKVAYNSLKAFWLIVLLNMLEKLIKKIISERLQV